MHKIKLAINYALNKNDGMNELSQQMKRGQLPRCLLPEVPHQDVGQSGRTSPLLGPAPKMEARWSFSKSMATACAWIERLPSTCLPSLLSCSPKTPTYSNDDTALETFAGRRFRGDSRRGMANPASVLGAACARSSTRSSRARNASALSTLNERPKKACPLNSRKMNLWQTILIALGCSVGIGLIYHVGVYFVFVRPAIKRSARLALPNHLSFFAA